MWRKPTRRHSRLISSWGWSARGILFWRSIRLIKEFQIVITNREQSLDEKILDHLGTAAMLKKAGQEAALEHARSGFPIAVWRDGKVAWLQPEEVFALMGILPVKAE